MRGFVFNGIKVTNENDVFYINSSIPATPQRTYFELNVPNRNGSNYFFNKFEDKEITVTIGIKGINSADINTKKRNLLQKFIGLKSKLIFLDEPDLYYKAEIFDTIESKKYGNYMEFILIFKASYCMFGPDKSIALISGVNKVNNAGNFRSETLIKITALGNCESITINNDINSFTMQSLVAGDEVYIDSEKMIVYKIIDGVKVSMMTQFTGKFLTIIPGSNNIAVTGTNYSANIELIFNDTYIV